MNCLVYRSSELNEKQGTYKFEKENRYRMSVYLFEMIISIRHSKSRRSVHQMGNEGHLILKIKAKWLSARRSWTFADKRWYGMSVSDVIIGAFEKKADIMSMSSMARENCRKSPDLMFYRPPFSLDQTLSNINTIAAGEKRIIFLQLLYLRNLLDFIIFCLLKI